MLACERMEIFDRLKREGSAGDASPNFRSFTLDGPYTHFEIARAPRRAMIAPT